MRCEQVQDRLIDFIDQNLDQESHKNIKIHLTNCDSCNSKLIELQTVLTEIDNTPYLLPKDELRINFEKMLLNEKRAIANTKVISTGKNTDYPWKTMMRIAATITLVISGYFLGKYQNNKSKEQKVAILAKEQKQEKQTITISLMENESASKRLQAVNYALEIEKPSNEILKALINKMHYDDHTNVRLAAAEALSKFSNSEMVRKAFINALNTEKDPSMQIELIQILVSIQEKRAIPKMEKLLQNEETPNYVIDQVKIGLPNLI